MKLGKQKGAKAITWDVDDVLRYDDAMRYCVQLTERQIAVLLPLCADQLQWSTRWYGDRSQIDISEFAANLANALMSQSKCTPKRRGQAVPIDWYWSQGGELIIDIHEDCKMTPVTVNIYEGCCGDETAKRGDATVQNNASDALGLPLSQRTTKCDYATSVVPYFFDSVRDWLMDVDIAVTNGAKLIDAVLGTSVELFDPTDLSANAVEIATEYLEDSLDAFIAVFDDPQMLLQTQVNYWGRVAEGTTYDNVTRQDLITLGASTPLLWGNAFTTGTVSPRALAEILSRVMNVQNLNAQNQIARGTAQNALCEYLASENGQTYQPLPTPLPPPPVIVGEFEIGGVDYGYSLAQDVTTLEVGENITVPVNEAVVGFVIYTTNLPTGGTTYTLANANDVLAFNSNNSKPMWPTTDAPVTLATAFSNASGEALPVPVDITTDDPLEVGGANNVIVDPGVKAMQVDSIYLIYDLSKL